MSMMQTNDKTEEEDNKEQDRKIQRKQEKIENTSWKKKRNTTKEKLHKSAGTTKPELLQKYQQTFVSKKHTPGLIIPAFSVAMCCIVGPSISV